MRREVMILLIVSLLTSCYNVSQSNLPKLQPSKVPVITSSIKPTQVKPSTIAVNQGNNVNSSTTTNSTIANTNPVVITTPTPTVNTNTSSTTNLSGGGGASSTTTSSSSSTSISTPDVKEITFTPNPNYNYPPPSLSPDVPVSIFDSTTYVPPPRPKPRYDINRDVPDGINPLDGDGLVIFKDEFKIRIKEGVLYSQTGADMSSINKLISDYNVKASVSYLVGTTQEELDKREKEMEAIEGVDIPNDASMYYIKFTNSETNLKEFFEKIRTDSKVLSANWVGRPIEA